MLKGHGAPNTGVVGNVGDYFEDLDTGKIYRLATIVLKEKQMGFVTIPEYVCETNQYVWVPVVDGGDLPWGENERENLFKSVGKNQSSDGGNDFAICEIKGLNRNKSYDFVIRGDVYPNVTAHSEHSYYDWVVWGTYSFNADGAEYPFALTTADDVHWQEGDKTGVSSMYDKDGNFDYDRNTSDTDPRLRISWTKYPDLKPEEIEIYDASIPAITKISGKYVEGMGWSEGGGGENIFNGAEPAYSSSDDAQLEMGDGCFCLGSPRININKSYDITIRGDVYKNVAPVKIHPYYWLVCWGVESYDDMTADAEYPFQITAGWLDCTDRDGNPIWDSNGDFVCKPGNVDNWAYPNICVNRDKYPDLKPEDVKITECEVIHPIDPKFMPFTLTTFYCSNEMQDVLWYNADDVGTYTGMVTYADAAKAVESGIIRFALPYGDAISYSACVMCSVDPEAGMVMLATSAGGQFSIARS